MGALTIRAATAGDLERIESIVNDPPGQEAVGVCLGDPALARRLARAFVGLGFSLDIGRCVVAEEDGVVAGVMEAGVGAEGPDVGVATVLRALPAVLRIAGPLRAARMVPNLRARARITPPGIPGSYYIAELDVAPDRRNRGIGGALLAHAERDARRLGVRQMSLHTTITNPARRLYERHGFRIVHTATDRAYERITGIPGRVLMVKDLV